jgi:hypothetical protein
MIGSGKRPLSSVAAIRAVETAVTGLRTGPALVPQQDKTARSASLTGLAVA